MIHVALSIGELTKLAQTSYMLKNKTWKLSKFREQNQTIERNICRTNSGVNINGGLLITFVRGGLSELNY
jgi:hypothetical protein